MSNPTTGSGACAPRIRRSRSGWTWTARLALAVLACTFAGAGQAQDRSDNLDHAVNSIIRDIANTQTLGVQLREQSVFVGADDFFEEETGFDLRPRLSEMLRAMCRTALTRNGVGNLEMVESNAAWVLHGRWWRETRDSQEYLHLRLFIARPVEGDTPPRQVAGYARLLPIADVVGNAIKPTLRHWGDSVVRQLESDLPGSGRYRLHIRPFEVQGAAQPERLSRRLHSRWRQAFTGSKRFRLVGSTGFDGELFGEVAVTDERVEVDLYVQDTEGQQVAAAHVAPDKGLFPSDLFGPVVTAKLERGAYQGFIGRTFWGSLTNVTIKGAKICLPTAIAERNLADFVRTNNIRLNYSTMLLPHAMAMEVIKKGICDAYSTDISSLKAMLALYEDDVASYGIMIYPERICCIPD